MVIMKKIPNIKVIYKAFKDDFDANPLLKRNMSTGDGWQVYHQIKMDLIERHDIDIWLVKNQFEFAIMLAAYRIDYTPELKERTYPVVVQFHTIETGTATNQFEYEIVTKPYPPTRSRRDY